MQEEQCSLVRGRDVKSFECKNGRKLYKKKLVETIFESQSKLSLRNTLCDVVIAIHK